MDNGSRTSLTVAHNNELADSFNSNGVTAANYHNLIEKGNSNSCSATFPGANAAGANFYLVKPVSQEVLIEHACVMCGLPK